MTKKIKTVSLADIQRLWRSDRRGPNPGYRKKRLDPGRKPKSALTISDIQAMSPEKLAQIWPDVWEERKGKK